MARHQLIAAQLDILGARLPRAAVDELADGLDETFEELVARCGDADTAAAATIEQFGDADTITAAFVGDSHWRRTATLILATGPVMGAVWAFTLIEHHAWEWPVPPLVRLLYALALVTVIVALTMVLHERRDYRRVRATTAGCAIGLATLDVAMIGTLATLSSAPTWSALIALAASLVRIVCITRALGSCLPA